MNEAALLPFGFDEGATFSACRVYRYRLWRSLGDREKRCVFVGVNPSTADEHDNDHTIRKCIGFARRWGFGAIDMVNLFALVSTDVTAILGAEDPVGPLNDEACGEAFKSAQRIVWCWGRHSRSVANRITERVVSSAWCAHKPRCETGTFGLNADGSPMHPLTLAYRTPFEQATS